RPDVDGIEAAPVHGRAPPGYELHLPAARLERRDGELDVDRPALVAVHGQEGAAPRRHAGSPPARPRPGSASRMATRLPGSIPACASSSKMPRSSGPMSPGGTASKPSLR